MILYRLHTRKTSYLFILLCLSFKIYATPAGTNQSHLIDQYLTSQCYYSGVFEQVREVTSVPLPLVSSGRFLYSCDHGLIWETLHPIKQIIIYTSTSNHFEINKNKDIKQLTGVAHQNMAIFLMSLLRGDSSSLKELFLIESDISNQNRISLISKQAIIKEYLKKITLSKNNNEAIITFVNNYNENTQIVTRNLHLYQSINLVQCKIFIQSPASACEALLLPQLVNESLTSGH